MMVWVVESSIDYEGSRLEDIFDSEEKAKAYVAMRKEEKRKRNEDMNYQSSFSHWWDEIDYAECEVN